MTAALIEKMSFILRLAERREARQFVKFCMVGSFNTALDFAVYYCLTRGTSFFGRHFVAAAVISFSIAVVSSFVLNTFWTFRAGGDGWRSRAPKFFAVAAVGVALNASIIKGLVDMGMFDLWAKVVAIGIVLFWNFTAQKKWTFKT